MDRAFDRESRSLSRAVARAGLLAAWFLSLAGCKQPTVGEPVQPAQVSGPKVEITGASVDGTGHLHASLRITRAGLPVPSPAEALALQPVFTVAALSTNPGDGLSAWRSLLLTGAQTLASLPAAGPGTPPSAVTTNVKQPGGDEGGTLTGGDGAFEYVYANALPASFERDRAP